MIWTVTVNPALDITYGVSELRPGQVHRVHDVQVRPGGKGLNVSRVLAALEVQTTATGFIGGHAGDLFEQLLGECKGHSFIHPAFVRTNHETRRSVAIVAQNEATVLNEAGAGLTEADFASLTRTLSAVGNSDVVAISGSFPPGNSDYLPHIVKTVKQAGGTCIVDTSGPALLEAAKAGADILKPNHEELADLTDSHDLQRGIDFLLGAGAGGVVCSRGEDGFVAQINHGERVRVAPPAVIAGNPTGAGDASVAALARGAARDGLAAAQDGTVLRKWLVDAAALAGAAVAAPVAGEIVMDVYDRLLHAQA